MGPEFQVGRLEASSEGLELNLVSCGVSYHSSALFARKLGSPGAPVMGAARRSAGPVWLRVPMPSASGGRGNLVATARHTSARISPRPSRSYAPSLPSSPPGSRQERGQVRRRDPQAAPHASQRVRLVRTAHRSSLRTFAPFVRLRTQNVAGDCVAGGCAPARVDGPRAGGSLPQAASAITIQLGAEHNRMAFCRISDLRLAKSNDSPSGQLPGQGRRRKGLAIAAASRCVD